MLDEASAPVVRRSTGENMLVEHGAARYNTQDLLDAEQRLLDYAHQPTTYALTSDHVLHHLHRA